MIVADTCVMIWDALSPKTLSAKVRRAVREANEGGGILVSDISLWEMAMLVKRGRVEPGVGYREFVDLVLSSNRYVVVPINGEIAETSVSLPDDAGFDPADRIIAATAMVHKLALATGDRRLRRFGGVRTIW